LFFERKEVLEQKKPRVWGAKESEKSEIKAVITLLGTGEKNIGNWAERWR
jgi:hypothetical protein